MEFLPLLQAIGSLLALVFLYNLIRIRTNDNKGKKTPEPLGAWPLIGHFHLFGGQIPPFRTLGAIADKHGPIFTIRLGMKRALIVSSWEAAKECLKKNDGAFLTRPNSAAAWYVGYGNAFFGLGPSGPYWREMRKKIILEVLSTRRLELLSHVRTSEVDTCIKDLYSQYQTCSSGSTVDMSEWFPHVITNVMIRMIAAKRYSSTEKSSESQRFRRAIREFFRLSGVFVLSDVIPYIEWMDLQGHVSSMKKNAKELDHFMSSWLEEHVQSRQQQGGKAKDEQDFMDVMLSSLEGETSMFGHKRDNIIKATSMNLIVGGTDTTSAALTWALSLLLNHKDALRCAQEELDSHVGRERWVEESDIKNLVYLQAIVKETWRLYPPGPLSVPRESLEDCYIDGYFIPKGTRLLVNIWKLHRDSRIWEEPNEFKPDRFLTTHAGIDVRGQHFEYIPFSSGKRSCPGISSALQMTHLTLARLLQGFNLTTPMNGLVDMTEGMGLSLPKAKSLEVILIPRLPHVLYQMNN